MSRPQSAHWSDWTLLDGLEPLLARRIDETVEGARARLEHLGTLGLMQFRSDEQGATFFVACGERASRWVRQRAYDERGCTEVLRGQLRRTPTSEPPLVTIAAAAEATLTSANTASPKTPLDNGTPRMLS